MRNRHQFPWHGVWQRVIACEDSRGLQFHDRSRAECGGYDADQQDHYPADQRREPHGPERIPGHAGKFAGNAA